MEMEMEMENIQTDIQWFLICDRSLFIPTQKQLWNADSYNSFFLFLYIRIRIHRLTRSGCRQSQEFISVLCTVTFRFINEKVFSALRS